MHFLFLLVVMQAFATGPVPDTDELVVSTHTYLATSAELEAELGGASRIHTHTYPDVLPWTPRQPGGRLLIFIAENPFGARSSAIGRRSVPLVVRMEVNDLKRGDFRPRHHLARIAAQVDALLLGWTPALTGATGHKLVRMRDPSPARPHTERTTLFSDVVYLAVLDPVHV